MPKLPSGVSIVTESALSLIFKDGPRGQFLCLTKDQDGNAKICAVDNNTGDAWTEDFNSLTAALYWLETRPPPRTRPRHTQRPRPPNSTTTLCERKSTATSKAREPLLRHWPTR